MNVDEKEEVVYTHSRRMHLLTQLSMMSMLQMYHNRACFVWHKTTIATTASSIIIYHHLHYLSTLSSLYNTIHIQQVYQLQ